MSAAYKIEPTDDVFSDLHDHHRRSVERAQSTEFARASHADVEAFAQAEGREYARRLAQATFDLQTARERPVVVRAADGVARTRRRVTQRRLRLTVGTVILGRSAYQADGVESLHPLDALQNLPEGLFSHGLARFVSEHAARMSFDEVRSEVIGATGESIGKRQLEQLCVHSARDFETFYEARRAANDVDEKTDDLLVLTFDGKGIVMLHESLREATRRAAEAATPKLSTRRSPGEKSHRKRMAEVASVYTVAPYRRTVPEVLDDLRRVRDEAVERTPRPKVENKRVWASVKHDPEVVIREAFADAHARDPEQRRRWVVLLDGNKDQLAWVKAVAAERGVKLTIVVDLIHVLEYLWKVAHIFCGASTPEAEAWVEQRLLWLLQGRPAGKIATAIRRQARAEKLKPDSLKVTKDAAKYLQN